jgi:D-alanine-D-alanine ligase-like ATP-grasp enzyme
VVYDIQSLQKQIAYILKTFDEPALVEEYIEGRELNAAIIGNEQPTLLPISEIDFSKLPSGYPKIVTYNAKWVEGTPEYTVLSEHARHSLTRCRTTCARSCIVMRTVDGYSRLCARRYPA